MGSCIKLKHFSSSLKNETKIALVLLFLFIVLFPYCCYARDEGKASLIKRHITIYGSSDLLKRDIETIAKHYHIVITEWWKHKDAENLKKLNPNMKIFFYRDLIGILESYDDWNAVNKNSEWFLKNSDTGALIKNKDHHWYLMDITNQHYQRHVITYINNKLKKYPVFDGVFLDDVVSYLNINKFMNESDKSIPHFENIFISSYRDSVKEILSNLKKEIGSKLIIINSNDEDEFIRFADGIMFEGFVIGSWQNYVHAAADSEWIRHMNLTNKYLKMNKMVLLQSSTKDKDSEAMQAFLFAFGSYLLLADERVTFFFEPVAKDKKTYRAYYSNIYASKESKVESSTDGQSWQVSTFSQEYLLKKHIYRRVIRNTFIVLNPTSMSFNIEIPKKYCEQLNEPCTSTITSKRAILLDSTEH